MTLFEVEVRADSSNDQYIYKVLERKYIHEDRLLDVLKQIMTTERIALIKKIEVVL